MPDTSLSSLYVWTHYYHNFTLMETEAKNAQGLAKATQLVSVKAGIL